MTTTKNKITGGIAMLIMVATLVIGGCSKDAATARKTVYQLNVKDQLGVSGTATFTETGTTLTTVEIVLTGADASSHPAHIHLNSAVEGGAISISLNPIVNGKSTTLVSMQDNMTSVNYTQLIAFDGYINVHASSTNLTQIIAQGDIGGNALTTTNKTYTLDSVGALGVSGTALFQKRVNGKTLVSISLRGTIAGGMHPADIRLGSVSTVGGGPVVISLNDVDGTTGKSYSNIRTLNTGTAISYDDLLVYDGYLAVHESALLMASVLCEGNIGTH